MNEILYFVIGILLAIVWVIAIRILSQRPTHDGWIGKLAELAYAIYEDDYNHAYIITTVIIAIGWGVVIIIAFIALFFWGLIRGSIKIADYISPYKDK